MRLLAARSCLAVLACVAWLAPLAHAHGAAAVLDNEIQLLQDEGDDAFYLRDGYDLYDLYVREAYWHPVQEDGLIFRFTLYGGFGPVRVAGEQAVELDVEVGGDVHAFRMATVDDLRWEGDMVVVFQDTYDDLTGVTSELQTFVPLSALNASRGDTIGGFAMRSYVDTELVDIAPGGIVVGGVEVPMESTRLVDALDLKGPLGYTETTLEISEDAVQLDVANRITVVGQHVMLRYTVPEGWELGPASRDAIEVQPGEDAHFTLPVARMGLEPVTVWVDSDLGGRETFYLHDDGGLAWAATRPAAATSAPAEDVPALPVLLVLGALFVARYLQVRP